VGLHTTEVATLLEVLKGLPYRAVFAGIDRPQGRVLSKSPATLPRKWNSDILALE